MRGVRIGKQLSKVRVIAGALILALAILSWGPWNTTHVASNP